MKILYHHRTAAKEGQYVHIEEMLNSFRAAGHQVVVVGPHGGEHEGFGRRDRTISALRARLPKPLAELAELGYSVVAFGRLQRAYREHRPDILYERYSLFQLAGCWLKRRYGIPYLLEVNAPLFLEREREEGGLSLRALARRTEVECWSTADLVLPVTQVLAEHVTRAGVAPERVHVIHNGINGTRFAAAGEAPGAGEGCVLGFVGFVRRWHGLDRIVDLLAADRGRNNLHLLIVGDGEIRAELIDQARRLGVAERVTITGVVPRDRVAAYIRRFDIALQPKVTKYASPLKIFEYLALAKPIVAPDQPNIREILSHEQQALLFDPDDPDAAGRAVMRLCEDLGLRRRLGQAGPRLIADRGFTWDANVRRIERLVASLRDRARPGAALREPAAASDRPAL